MFKAFTDNISSFINNATGESGDDGKKSATTTEESSSHPQTESQQQDVPANDVTTEHSGESLSKVEGNGDASTTASEGENRRSSKVPPPRPNPPLTTGASISKEENDGDDDKTKTEKSGDTTEQGSDGKKDRLDDKLEEVAGKAKEWGSE